VQYVSPSTPVYLIDPNPVAGGHNRNIIHIEKGASEGMKELIENLTPTLSKGEGELKG
jgi:NAD-dependent deacetylase